MPAIFMAGNKLQCRINIQIFELTKTKSGHSNSSCANQKNKSPIGVETITIHRNIKFICTTLIKMLSKSKKHFA